MQVSSIKSLGFTIVELMVVITVSTITMGVVVFSLGSYYQDNISSVQKTTQDTDTRSVLRSIESELASTNGFTANLTISPGSTPLGSNNVTAAWSYKGNDALKPNNRVLIGQTYATDKVSTDDTRMVIFTDTSATGCDPSVATPVKNARIYFVAKDPSTNIYNLYRRTIVNTVGGSICGTPIQKQTCAPWTSPSYPSICKGNDAQLLANVESFTVDYYTSSNDSTPVANEYTTALSTDIEASKAIKLTVVTNRLINGNWTQSTASIRVNRAY